MPKPSQTVRSRRIFRLPHRLRLVRTVGAECAAGCSPGNCRRDGGDLARELIEQARRHVGGGVQRRAGAASTQHHRPAAQPVDIFFRRDPSRSAPATAAIAAVPLKHDPHCPAFSRSKYASTDAATATGQSSVITEIAPQPSPLPSARIVSWSSVVSERHG